MSKQVEISMDSIKQGLDSINQYFENLPVDEEAAWGAIGAGLLFVIAGLLFL